MVCPPPFLLLRLVFYGLGNAFFNSFYLLERFAAGFGYADNNASAKNDKQDERDNANLYGTNILYKI